MEVEKKKRVAFSLFLFDILHERNDNVTITFAKSAIQSSKVSYITNGCRDEISEKSLEDNTKSYFCTRS